MSCRTVNKDSIERLREELDEYEFTDLNDSIVFVQELLKRMYNEFEETYRCMYYIHWYPTFKLSCYTKRLIKILTSNNCNKQVKRLAEVLYYENLRPICIPCKFDKDEYCCLLECIRDICDCNCDC